MMNDDGEWVQLPTRMIISTANPRGSLDGVANGRVLNSQPALEGAIEQEISCVEGKFVVEKASRPMRCGNIRNERTHLKTKGRAHSNRNCFRD